MSNEHGVYDCYNKAQDGEPIFVLLGRDPEAPKCIRDWALARVQRHLGSLSREELVKVNNAWHIASDMEVFQADYKPIPAEVARNVRQERDEKFASTIADRISSVAFGDHPTNEYDTTTVSFFDLRNIVHNVILDVVEKARLKLL